PNSPLNNSLHAEQFVSIMTLKNKERLKALALTAEPCGHCRQFLIEMNEVTDLDIILPGALEKKLKQLLPNSFGPKNLGVKTSLYDDRDNHLILTNTKDLLALEALKQANLSYAPYTESYSGMAMSVDNDKMVSGFYIENVAFNPSVSPLMSTLAHLRSLDLNYSDIVKVVLVEKKNATIRQEKNIRNILNIISPKVIFEVYEAMTV
ncbi:MAG: cytidine deaminase, partial [bacterium]